MFESSKGYTTSNQRLKVPLNLLHVNETLYTDTWSKNTYKYHHFFDNLLNESRPQEGESNLKKWKDKAILMTHEIKQKGMITGKCELCRVATEEYGLTIPGRLDTNSHCTDIDDVLCIVTNNNWYYEDINKKRNIIYHFLYGLTRPGNNIWLINAEKQWMEQKGIVYDYDNLASKRKTRIKGFVYSIMHSMFSNYVQKTFRNKMLLHFNEFITVREKVRNKSSNSKYQYQKHQFGNNRGYIVSIIDDNVSESITSLPKLLTVGKNWVKDCKHQGYSLELILKRVEDFYNGQKIIKFGEEKTVKDTTNIEHAMNVQTCSYVSENDSVRKAPSDAVLQHLRKKQVFAGTFYKIILFLRLTL